MWRRMPLVATMALVLLATAFGVEGPRPTTAVTAAQPAGDRLFVARHVRIGDEHVGVVFEITSGTPVEFARLRLGRGEWIGALAVSPDGRLHAVTDAENGSLWDVTAGGDLTKAEPRAKGFFPRNLNARDLIRGLTFDADGNAYLLIPEGSNAGRIQPVVKVAADGTVSQLPFVLEGARSLVVREGVLYASEHTTGRVISYNLATEELSVFASGFGGTRAQGPQNVDIPELVVDQLGRLLVFWETIGLNPIANMCCNRPALYDITNGGDFADVRDGLVVSSRSSSDRGVDGPLAVDSANNVYAASHGVEGGDWVYISRFGEGAFGPFEQFAEVPASPWRITGLAVMRQP